MRLGLTKSTNSAVVTLALLVSGPALAQYGAPREPVTIEPLPPKTITVKPGTATTTNKAAPEVPPGAGAAVASDGRLVLTKEFCSSVTTYVAPPDVAYTPGVDVNGRAVAPADLPGSTPYRMNDPIQTAIILDTSRFSALPTIAGRGETYPVLLSVDPTTGAVTMNGKRIDGGDEATLAKLCREQGLLR